AIVGKVGVVRRDPFAMLPFCGYHFGDYFKHWLDVGAKVKVPPKIFTVNWFRRDSNGKFLWPGFGDNMRILKWVVERCDGSAGAVETPIGNMPRYEDLEWKGMTGFSRETFDKLIHVDHDAWRAEIKDHDELFGRLTSRLPAEMTAQRQGLEKAL
ncbi:MAG: phosphoenolpyruvate carboxykinase (GTP), partial [Betaproteobacteria bacterium]|nr:phosphoenolpyruvate carboxykinase (GTP) [Betaproteobacteria bacterium]